MNRYRILFFVAATLSATFWAYACGDGATEPPAPPPDPPRPTTVTVAPATALLTALGATVQLTAEVRDQNGQVMAGAGATWTSSNASVATVGGSGLVTAAGNGTATITATAGGVSGTATVTVTQVVSAVVVSPAADTLVAGDTLRLSAEATDANGHPVAGAEFTWASGDTSVAVVDGSGLVTGTGAGEVEITATSSGVTGRGEFTVVAPAPTAIVVTPDTVALTALGETEQLAAEVRDQAGRAMAGVAVSWSSADTTVAAVDSAGLVTAAGSGATTITAAAGQASGEAVVTVMPSAGSVVVTPAAGTVAPGDTLRLVAEAFDENGHGVEGAEFDWSSSDVSAARVDGSGLVTGVAEGTATITAMVGDARGTAEITVGNPDRAALVALYNATDGPNWVDNTNWLTDAPLGEWYGVDTNAAGRVVRIDLTGRWPNEIVIHGLRGELPVELANLTELVSLRLGLNSLTGRIPAELASLASLTSLSFWENELSGPIPPELGSLASLTSLDLWGNELSGPIPPELGSLASLTDLNLGGNALSGPIPPELGDLANLRSLGLSNNGLSGPIPPELGDLANLRGLDLPNNGLSGPIPPELGNLASLQRLFLAYNDLSGSIPAGFVSLPLQVFSWSASGACAPGTSLVVEWLDGMRNARGPFCNAFDRTALTNFFDLTDGEGWRESAGWQGGAALEEWHGIRTDSLGRVVELDLSNNGLTGRLPASVGVLSQLEVLRIGDNALSGRLPLLLAELPLRELSYASTRVCAPDAASFQDWLATIDVHEGTGIDCSLLTDREILEVLYHSTGGVEWHDSENWLTDAPLWDWYGVETDAEGRVVRLALAGFSLMEPFGLEGSIPPELGQLDDLVLLNLENNGLSGPIPPGLGDLEKLQRLYLNGNQLSGPIPPGLGDLEKLQWLYLNGNQLSGPIPPRLGNLTRLRGLHLDFNRLSGPVPPSLGGMTNLTRLTLSGNAELEGSLPLVLTQLGELDELVAGGTELCAPAETSFQAWLSRLSKHRIATCSESAPPAAYLTQTVQSLEFPVTLVAGRGALLRVFATAATANSARMPMVRARLYVSGRETHTVEVASGSGPMPTAINESDLASSVNVEIPGEVIRPGLEMVIEVDPDGTLDPELGVAKRIPDTGRLAVDVKAMPLFDLTLIPFVWTETHDSSIVDLVGAMAADPEHHEMLADARILLPIGELAVTAHKPVLSSSNNIFTLLNQTDAIRVMEGGTGHYKGLVSAASSAGGFGGSAYQPGRSSLSTPSPDIIAHELGHNLNLSHAPCGGAPDPDPAYPYPDGSIGAWGYDFRAGGRLVRPSTPDLMTYCGPPDWVSDYHFANALRHRLFDEGTAAVATVSASMRSLLLWGGVGANNVPYLEPAFVVDAPTALPDSAGEYRIAGRTAASDELFSFSFTMPVTADGDGSSGFAFALPVRAGWEGSLATITLDGPGGTVTLDGETDIPRAILRDPRTGQVRGILRDPPQANEVAADAVGAVAPGLEVLFSRGIPGAAAWRR